MMLSSLKTAVNGFRISSLALKSTAGSGTRPNDRIWRMFSSGASDPPEVCLSSYEYLFNPNILKGKVAFITGGGSGIGFTIAEILMRHGCRTAIASRKLERVQTAADTLEAATGQKCLPLQMDVRKPEEILTAVDKTLAEFNGIDIVINNAAGNFLSPAAGLSCNAYKTVLEIDTMGTFNVSKTVFDKYLKDHGGVILNISATLAYRGQVFQTHAGSAKAAIDALTKHLGVEWGPLGIRVVGVAPGPIGDTEGTRRLGGTDADMHRAMLETIPLQRAGTRVEIGHTVLFLVSPAGSLITAETVVADGGSWYTWGNSMQDAMRLLQSYQKGS